LLVELTTVLSETKSRLEAQHVEHAKHAEVVQQLKVCVYVCVGVGVGAAVIGHS